MVNPLQTNNRTGQKFGGASATSVPSHNVLTDLLVGDAHTQYVRSDGTRSGWPTPSATPLAGAIPLADGSGTLNAWVSAASGGLSQPQVMARHAFGGF